MPSVLIIGSSRGLGLEWVKHYKLHGYQIMATTKDKGKADNLEAILDGQDILLEMDVTQPDSIKAAMGQIETIPDLIIYNAGTKGYTKDPSGRTTVFNAVLDVDGETSMEAGLLEAFQVNAFGFHRVMSALKQKLVNSGSTVAYITSGVANYNESGGYPNYRESKIAGERYAQSWDLALMELSSIANRPRVFALHPGIVNTGMGAGFTDIEPAGRVKEMAAVITEVGKTGDTFGVRDYKGAKYVGYVLPNLLVKNNYKKEIEGDVKPKHRLFVAQLLMNQGIFTPKLKQGEIDDPNFIQKPFVV